MSETALITGAFGLVGAETVRRFAADGWRVVATANRTAGLVPAGVQVRHVDLRDPEQVRQLVAEVSPDVIVHLAAVIPPLIYYDAELGRKLNVDATAALVRAAEEQADPPRFLHASSCSVYGSRNPYRHSGLIEVDTPLRPCEVYGHQKLEAEQIVRSSGLDWVVLRLGGVLSVDPSAMPFTSDTVYFGSAMPIDGRVHCVDTRDVATAFAAAAHADVIRQILLIGGDESHKLRQGEIGSAIAASQGMVGLMPRGRPGDPDNDAGWYINDWMEVTRAQELLKFQHFSWPDMLAEMRQRAGWQRHPRRLAAPVARQLVKRQAAYRKWPGQYADVWGALRARYGDGVREVADAE